MGNRGGRLHRPDFTLGAARWRSRAWICCRTTFRDRCRTVMGTGYTEIFFLDVATALAAGHRPCFECRRHDANAFAAAWARAKGCDRPPRAKEMDAILHAERRAQCKPARLSELPAGAIFGYRGDFLLWHGNRVLLWGHDRYVAGAAINLETLVVPVTPEAIRDTFFAGYAPSLHATATQILSAR